MQSDSHLENQLLLAICKRSQTPYALGVYLSVQSDFSSACHLEIDPKHYINKTLREFSMDYGISSLLKKWKDPSSSIDKAFVAIQKFKTSEELCRETNIRLKRSLQGANTPFDSVLFGAKVKIAKLLGTFSLFAVAPYFGWGPGATVDLSRRCSQVDRKMMQTPLSVSSNAIDLFRSIVCEDLHWSVARLGQYPDGPFSELRSNYKRVDYCRITTVPKSSKTDRVIAIEPTGNLFLQKGVGGFFRKRLKSVGVDLDDQTINQSYAAKAYTDDLATLDLKSASDSISKELVKQLLPYDWWSFLEDLRSRSALMPDGSVSYLEKFSSMGNGFTFELESLIFWALGRALLDSELPGGVLAVYGDDIIISRSCAPELIKLLAFVGFEVNEEKSFVDGEFFESCGKHYFRGYDVTPCYQKEVVDTLPEAIRFYNRVYRWCERIGIPTDMLDCIRRKYPSPVFIPHGTEGDDGYLRPLEAIVFDRSVGFNDSLGWRCRVLKYRPKTFPGFEPALLALALRVNDGRPWNPLLERVPGSKSLASYGNILIAEQTAKRVYTLGYRWVTPPGVCMLPIR
jgi:hypothetical protein